MMFLNAVRRCSTRFQRNQRGNVIAIFAICIVPLVSLIGAAVDYGRAVRARSAMQAAADAAALMISKDAANLDSAEITTKAQAYFNALFQKDGLSAAVTTVYTPNTGQGATVKIDASSAMSTDFMRVAGYPTLNLNVSSTTTWGSARLRLALSLDNTGSMDDDGKMTALKKATKKLINKLRDSATNPGDIYVSIVPFSKDVNVGSSNQNETWIRWTEWDEVNGSCSSGGYSTKTTCQGAGKTWTAQNHNNWNGCVTDRDQNHDVSSTLPTTTATSFPAEKYSDCPQSMMGLTYDWKDLKDKVNDMTPVGNTNQPIGLAWAWQTLTPNSPFPPPAEDPNYQYQKVIIHMSDGLNTQNRWSSDQATIDARQATMCTNIKGAGITIYMVQVNTGGDPTQTVMQNCASDPDKFFMLTSGNQLVATFDDIGDTLTKLRISR